MKPQSGAVAIFVKTPGHSPVKTRLAQTLGSDFAENFYLKSVGAIEEAVKHAIASSSMNLTPYWAVTETGATHSALWSSFTALTQTGEGLGERMAGIYSTLLEKHSFVMLIGADAPQIEKRHFISAVSAQERFDFVFGPATDGGFYLFSGKTQVPTQVWTQVTYSASDTRLRLENHLSKLGSIAHLDSLTDVDTEQDLSGLIQTMKNQTLLPAQQKLLSWLENTKL